MANVLARRTGLLFKIKELSQLSLPNTCASAVFIKLNHTQHPKKHNFVNLLPYGFNETRHYSDDKQQVKQVKVKEQKLTVFQKFKQMYKDYWYVLVPVHVATSAVWFGGFYYVAKSGIDIVAILDSWNLITESMKHSMKDSSMGHLAVAYALYKVATPARYTVTLGGTTVSINYLKKWGYIKPVPSAEELKQMYNVQKVQILETVNKTQKELHIQSEKLKDKKEFIMEDLKDKKITIMDDIKDKKDIIMEDIEKNLEQLKKISRKAKRSECRVESSTKTDFQNKKY